MLATIQRVVRSKSGIVAIAQTAAANLAIQAANIGSGIITARALGPVGRGTLSAVIMWPQFLAYALSFGLPVASVYWVKRRPETASALTGAAIVLSIAAGLLACIVGVCVIPYSLHKYTSEQIHFAQIAVILCPVTLCAVTLGAQVQSAGKFTIYNLFRFLTPLSVVIVLGIEKLTGTLTATTAAIAYLLSGLPATVWIATWVWRHFSPTFRGMWAPAKTLLSYGLRAWGTDLLATVANQVDRVLVLGMLRPEAMGLYVVAQSAAGALAILPNAVSPVTLPKSAGLDNTEIRNITGKALRMTLLVMVLASLPLFLCGGLLLKLVYGAKYLDAALVLPFLVVESILDGLTAVLAQAFLAAGIPGTITFVQGLGLLTAIPLLYWLIPRYGLRGAGAALMMGTMMRFLFVLLSFPARMKMRPPSMLVGPGDIRALLEKVRNTASS